jgi:hypothetical protein
MMGSDSGNAVAGGLARHITRAPPSNNLKEGKKLESCESINASRKFEMPCWTREMWLKHGLYHRGGNAYEKADYR